MTQVCSILDSLDALVERIYAAPIDLDTHLFKHHEVIAMMALAAVGYPSSNRMAQIAAKSFSSLSVGEQELLRSLYEIPARVRDHLTTLPTWPDQKIFDPVEFSQMTSEQEADYRKRRSAELDRHAEEQTVRVMTPGFGKVLTYVWKVKEAQEYIEKTLAEEEINDADYPFLLAEVGATADTMFNVAQVIMFMAHAWVGARAQIEHAVFHARKEIQDPETSVEQIPGIVEQAKGSMTAAIDYIISQGAG